MNSSWHDSRFEEVLAAELVAHPSPGTAARMDERVARAVARRGAVVSRGRMRGQGVRAVLATPIGAAIAVLVLGMAVVSAALVINAEDERVIDLTACMLARGWQLPDADTSGGTGHVVPGFSAIVEEGRQDAFNADLAGCAAEVGIPLGR